MTKRNSLIEEREEIAKLVESFIGGGAYCNECDSDIDVEFDDDAKLLAREIRGRTCAEVGHTRPLRGNECRYCGDSIQATPTYPVALGEGVTP
jgi:hypothetical protein